VSSSFGFPDPVDDPWASLLADNDAPVGAESIYPPLSLMVAAICVIVTCWALFFIDSKVGHWVGYGLGVIATSLIVLAYRHQLLIRRRERTFVDKPTWNRLVAIAMPVGIISGFLHVWFALSEQRVR
jgi:hypothetical protein